MFQNTWLETEASIIVPVCLIILLASRILPNLLIKQDPTDKWSHVLDAQAWSEAGKLPSSTNRFVPYDDFSYPFGVSFFLKFFKRKPVEKFVWLNLAVNIAELIFLYLFAFFFLNLESAVLLMLMTSIIPSVLSPWYGLFGVNARNIGATITTGYLITVYASISLSSPHLTIALSAFLFFMAIYFSQFAIQTIIISSLFVSFWFATFVSLIPILITLSLVFVLNIKSAKKIMLGHFKHVKFYYKFLQYHAVATLYRNRSLHELFFLSTYIVDFKRFFLSFPFLRLFIFYPIILFYILFKTISVEYSILQDFAICLVVMNFILCLCIPIKGLRFLEADRYFMFGSNLIVFLAFAEMLAKRLHIWAIPITLLSSLWYLILLKLRISYNLTADVVASEKEIVKMLKKEKLNEETVLCVPTNISDKMAVLTHHKFVGLHTNVCPDSKKWGFYENLYSDNFYPYPNLNNETLLDALRVGLIVVSKKFTNHTYLKSNNYPNAINLDTKKFKKYLENEDFILLKREFY